ncbi:MAG TPA: deoxyribodipyrimidine photo-lyase [Armatimonadota bacterium]|jgi:deoxyribodipyrimidine photo-lyase
MQAAQRADDNPALNEAIRRANALGAPVVVFFALDPAYPSANARHYAFMLDGLRETEAILDSSGIPFILRRVLPEEGISVLARELNALEVVADIGALRHQRAWREKVSATLTVPFMQVTTNTVLPAHAFGRLAATAGILRPFVHRHLPDVVWEHPRPAINTPIHDLNVPRIRLAKHTTDELLRLLGCDRSVPRVATAHGGSSPATAALNTFITERLPRYASDRHRAETSRLSAYLHFGQIAPHAIARAVMQADSPQDAKHAFLEQLLVRRELAHNFCWYSDTYDRFDGCPEWGKASLLAHAEDPRPVVYTREQLESADTHDEFWNTVQRQMVETGFMHGYTRMVWAKKILEWSETPEDAHATAVYLNDRYQLDGRDPNGYTGIAWSIGGRHDRPWPQRPIFGAIRYMSTESARRKLGFSTAF